MEVDGGVGRGRENMDGVKGTTEERGVYWRASSTSVGGKLQPPALP